MSLSGELKVDCSVCLNCPNYDSILGCRGEGRQDNGIRIGWDPFVRRPICRSYDSAIYEAVVVKSREPTPDLQKLLNDEKINLEEYKRLVKYYIQEHHLHWYNLGARDATDGFVKRLKEKV